MVVCGIVVSLQYQNNNNNSALPITVKGQYMKATFIIYKIERFTFKNEVVFETSDKIAANAKYRELNVSLTADSDHSYLMQVR